MRDFRDDQLPVHVCSVRGFTRPLEFDFDIIDRDQPEQEDQRQKQKVSHELRDKQARSTSKDERCTGRCDDILGLALTELDVSIHLCHVSDLDRFLAVSSDLYRSELTLEPLRGPGRDVLVLPMPVGGGLGHGLEDRHGYGYVWVIERLG